MDVANGTAVFLVSYDYNGNTGGVESFDCTNWDQTIRPARWGE